MSTISREVADKLFEVCNWAHKTWVLHRTLYDDNPDLTKLGEGHHVSFLSDLNFILQEYSLQQIAKLHDPAIMKGRANLSLAHIVDSGGWDSATVQQLGKLKAALDVLDAQIRPARHSILSHNDLATVLANQSLGGFPKDADVEYFRTLHEFVSIVFTQVTGSACAEFSTQARTSARGVVRALLASDAARQR